MNGSFSVDTTGPVKGAVGYALTPIKGTGSTSLVPNTVVEKSSQAFLHLASDPDDEVYNGRWLGKTADPPDMVYKVVGDGSPPGTPDVAMTVEGTTVEGQVAHAGAMKMDNYQLEAGTITSNSKTYDTKSVKGLTGRAEAESKLKLEADAGEGLSPKTILEKVEIHGEASGKLKGALKGETKEQYTSNGGTNGQATWSSNGVFSGAVNVHGFARWTIVVQVRTRRDKWSAGHFVGFEYLDSQGRVIENPIDAGWADKDPLPAPPSDPTPRMPEKEAPPLP